MRTIWKFLLNGSGVPTIDAPANFHPLDVQVQEGFPVLWAVVDTDAPKVPTEIVTVGTGDPLPDNYRLTDDYVGTYMLDDGLDVCHVFWRA